MMHKAWSGIEEMPYCFWGSSVKFLGHTAKKIVDFDRNWAFLDCNSSLNSPMGTKWCTKLEVAWKRCPIVFQGHPSNFKAFATKPQYQHQFFYIFLKTIIWRTQNLQKNAYRFKAWMGFVGQILIKFFYFRFSLVAVWIVRLGVSCANMLVATRWPLKRAPHITSFARVCVEWRSESSLELTAL